MEIQKGLLELKPREEAGSKTSSKYSFQHDLSLFILLENHDKLDDYVYLFDFHDDLVKLNSSVNPSSIDFFQIKTKEKGNWTINAISKPSKVNSNSIIGKMYLNKINFPNNTQSINFISNAPFSIGLKSIKEHSLLKTEIKVEDISENDYRALMSAIAKEFPSHNCKTLGNLIIFKVTKLSDKDSSTHCLGELTRVVHNINPNHKVNPQLAYNQIIGEIKRRTNNTIGDKSVDSFEGLVELKGISKKNFIDFLKNAGLYKSFEDEWLDIAELIKSADIGFMELSNMKNSLRRVTMELINESNSIPLMSLKNEIEELLANTKSIPNPKWNIIEVAEFYQAQIKSSSFYDQVFIKYLIIKILYENM